MSNSEITVPPDTIDELNAKIINDSITSYNNRNELIKVIENLRKENESVINDFVDLVIMLTEQLATIMPDSMVNKNKQYIIDHIKQYSKYFIDGYIDKAYMNKKTKDLYRKNLVQQNEEFFLNNNFEDVTEGQESIVDKLFKFKDFWSKLKEENKQILKFYLTTMCYYADKRYIYYHRYLTLKSLNEKYQDIFTSYDKLI